MDQKKVFITILGMMLVTYLPRYLPAAFLVNRRLPDSLVTWLRFVPPAVMAALLLPSVLVPDGELRFDTGNAYLLATIPTFLVAYFTRNFFGTIVAGAVFVGGLRFFS